MPEESITFRQEKVAAPILRHEKWLVVLVPPGLSKEEFLKRLPNWDREAQAEATRLGLEQIRLEVPADWVLMTARYAPAHYYVTAPAAALRVIKSPFYEDVRPESPGDFLDLVAKQFAYHREANRDFFTENPKESAARFLEQVRREVPTGEAIFVGSRRGREPTAFGYLQFSPPALINELYVDPVNRGYGYGKAIMKHLGDALAGRGVETVGLFVAVNIPAIDFYLHLGFSKKFLTYFRNL